MMVFIRLYQKKIYYRGWYYELDGVQAYAFDEHLEKVEDK